MLRKNNRDIIMFFIVISLLLIGVFYLSSNTKGGLPPYSVLNKSKNGTSIFFTAMQQLHYPIKRTVNPINTLPYESLAISSSGGNFNINAPNLKLWVEKGGRLIYLTEGVLPIPIYNKFPKREGSFYYYNFNNGLIILADVNNITNKTLLKDTKKSYELLKTINNISYDYIYFNENSLLGSNPKISLWDYTPLEYKFILYQLLLVLCGFIYLKGKRFGRPVPFFEEIERTPNEYLYSSSSLYLKGNCWDLMLENYYVEFKKQFSTSTEDWLSLWEQEQLPSYDKAKALHAFLQNPKPKIKARNYIEWVKLIDELTHILKKRRDSYWKESTKSQ